MPSHRFDVFLCHNSQDKPAVKEIDRRLWENGIHGWLDERDLRAGSSWLAALEEQAESVPAVAIFVGTNGRGPWQEQERRVFLDQVVKRQCRVIPVILADGEETPEFSPFLGQYHAVDFRKSTPDPMVQLIRAIDAGASAPPSASDPQQKLWNVPYQRNPYFTGREAILEDLRERLTQNGTAALGQTQAISGLGGIGKTQTAVEYAYRHRDAYQAIFFVRAETEAEILSGFGEIARLLGHVDQEQEQMVAIVLGWLSDQTDWLLILDNADEPELLKPYLPTTHRGHVLLTSRARVFTTLRIARPLRIPPMPRKEALQFLVERAERSSMSTEERRAAEALAQELGYLPLALEQAGAYIYEQQYTFEEYLTSYKRRGLELLDRATPDDHPEVSVTWSMNLQAVEETSPASAEILRASAFLSPDDIPLEILTLGAEDLGPILAEALADDTLSVNELLSYLTRYSLIQRDVGRRTYSVHRLVQEVSKLQMDGEDQQAWATRAVDALNRAFPHVEFRHWTLCERLLPQAVAAQKTIGRYSLNSQEAASLLYDAGSYADERARYDEAESLYLNCLQIRESSRDHDEVSVAYVLQLLGILYWRRGRYNEAEPLYRRSLEIEERALGPEHPDVAETLSNLGILYRDQGRYEEAEPLCRRSLEIEEKALGPEHPNVARALEVLGILYMDLGRLSEAESLFERSRKIYEEKLGEDHPELARLLNNLGLLYRNQGRYEEAEPLHRRDLEITQKALGPEHPSVAYTLNNLGLLYRAQGRYEEAEPLYRRSLEIKEKALGPEHPSVAITLRNYADLLRKTDRDDEAAELDAKAEKIESIQR